jgi:hypothetical protein
VLGAEAQRQKIRYRPVHNIRKPSELPVRSDGGLAEAKTVDGNGKSRKLSRTEVWMEQAQAEIEARLAHIRPPQAGQEPAGEWLFGAVQRYDPRTMSGTVATGAGLGRLELSFGAAAVMRAGITTLHPSQSVECRITRRPDGTLVVTEIKLSAGECAAALAELERQAQAAEENYRIELTSRRVH